MRDIRPVKKQLRETFQARRDAIPEPQRIEMSAAITDMLVRLNTFLKADAVLTYVSTGSEVSTFGLLEYCFSQGKRVAAPKCFGKRQMRFYVVSSLADLSVGSFGLYEPDPEKCEPLTVFDNTFCIVPGLSFDRSGARLGYGGGYYDSFLSDYGGTYLGVCFSACVGEHLPRGRYDVAFRSVLTEKGIFLCNSRKG